MERHYVYRSTQDKLNEHIAHIEESGDQIIPPLYWTGGRDWLILCRALPKESGPSGSVDGSIGAGRASGGAR